MNSTTVDSGITGNVCESDECLAVFRLLTLLTLVIGIGAIGAVLYRRWRRQEYFKQLTEAIGYPVTAWDPPSSMIGPGSSSSSNCYYCFFSNSSSGSSRNSGSSGSSDDGCIVLIVAIFLIAVISLFVCIVDQLFGGTEPHFKVKHPTKSRTYAKVINTRTAFVYRNVRFVLVSQLADQIRLDFSEAPSHHVPEPTCTPSAPSPPPPPPYTPPSP